MKQVNGIYFTFLITFFAAASAVAQTEGRARTPDVPYVPTPPEVVEAMLKAAGVTKNDIIYDLLQRRRPNCDRRREKIWRKRPGDRHKSGPR